MTREQPQFRVLGRAILGSVTTAYQPFVDPIAAAAARVVVIRFSPSPGADRWWSTRMEASRISAEHKQRVFTRLGAGVDLHVLPDTAGPAQLATVIDAANEDPAVAAIIVQTPTPRRLVPLLDRITPGKDIDALGVDAQRPACATADGIARVAAPFLRDGASVAVVGANGFVGSGVTALLQSAGHLPLCLDLGDDLRRVARVDVVISTTGRPGLLTAEHVHAGHRLVIDSGFVPQPDGPVGDVHPDATHLPAAITPVPGGIGPVEMAVLAERLVQTVAAPNLSSWAYSGRGVDASTTAAQTVTAHRCAAAQSDGELAAQNVRPDSPSAPRRRGRGLA